MTPRFIHALSALLIVAVAVLGSTGCDRISLPNPQSLLGGGAERPEASSDLESLESGKATQIYYQFIDDRQRVRFVTSLDLVPEAWRDRVGHVEMEQAPPMSPQDMQRIVAARNARYATRSAQQKRGPEIVIYSADWCPACVRAKRYMDGEGIEYEERNVDQPRYKDELIRVSGGRSIPVIQVDGNVLRGFSAQRLDQMIQAAN